MGLVDITLKLIKINLESETLEEVCERIVKKREEELPIEEGATWSESIIADLDGYYVIDDTLFKVKDLEIEDFGAFVNLESDEDDPSIMNFTAVCDEEEISIEDLITRAFYED